MQTKKSDRIEIFYEIIRLIKENSQQGLNRFYSEYGKIITTAARRYGLPQDKVKLVENNVLIRVWQSVHKLGEVTNPEGLIFTIARNCAKDELTEKWFYELNEKICSGKDPFREIEDDDSFEYLISCLKEHEQEVLILKFRQGYSFQEIANIAEKPLPTISSIYYRALDKIEDFVKDKEI